MGDFWNGVAEGAAKIGVPMLLQGWEQDRKDEKEQAKLDEDKRRWNAEFELKEKNADQERQYNEVRLDNAKMEQRKLQVEEAHRNAIKMLDEAHDDPVAFAKIQSSDTMNADGHDWEYAGQNEEGEQTFYITDRFTGKKETAVMSPDMYKDALLKFKDPTTWKLLQKLKMQANLAAEQQAARDKAAARRREEEHKYQQDQWDKHFAAQNAEIAARDKRREDKEKRQEISRSKHRLEEIDEGKVEKKPKPPAATLYDIPLTSKEVDLYKSERENRDNLKETGPETMQRLFPHKWAKIYKDKGPAAGGGGPKDSGPKLKPEWEGKIIIKDGKRYKVVNGKAVLQVKAQPNTTGMGSMGIGGA